LCELGAWLGPGFDTSITVPVGWWPGFAGGVGFARGSDVADWLVETLGLPVFDAVALAEPELDGVADADADPDDDDEGFWLRGTTTTGVPPEFGVTMNCDPGLWAVVL
jgi:hypothetical protein